MSDPRPGFLDPGSRPVPFSPRLFSTYSYFFGRTQGGWLFLIKTRGKEKKGRRKLGKGRS